MEFCKTVDTVDLVTVHRSIDDALAATTSKSSRRQQLSDREWFLDVNGTMWQQCHIQWYIACVKQTMTEVIDMTTIYMSNSSHHLNTTNSLQNIHDGYISGSSLYNRKTCLRGYLQLRCRGIFWTSGQPRWSFLFAKFVQWTNTTSYPWPADQPKSHGGDCAVE